MEGGPPPRHDGFGLTRPSVRPPAADGFPPSFSDEGTHLVNVAVSDTDQFLEEIQGSLKTLLKGGGLAVIGVVLRRFLNLLYIIVITAVLGADGFGAYMLLVGVATTMTVVATMGHGQGTMRFVAQHRAGGRAD
jgi:hypothetical protein